MTDAYSKGLSLLSVREHTGKELRGKLSARGFSPEDIEQAVSLLRQEGFLSEERYAEVFIRSRMRKSPEGRPLLLLRLQEKGVAEQTAKAAVSLFWEEGEYKGPLCSLCRSLAGRRGKEKARLALLAKGFCEAEVRFALSQVDASAPQ